MINGYALLITTPHNSPVAIRLSADHHNMDAANFKYGYQLVFRRLQIGRVWFRSSSASAS